MLEYDDVANDQRHAIYEQRNYLLDNDDISETIKAIRSDVFNDVIDQYIPPQSLEEQWDIKGLEERLAQEFGLELPIEHWLEENNNLHEENLRERIIQEAEDEYKAKEALAGEETMRHFEKGVMLQTLDELGKSTWLQWIIYVKVSIYVVMRKKIQNKSTKKNLSVCLLKC